MTKILEALTRPDVNGTPSLPKRAGPKGLLPSTWVERTLRVSYVDCYGAGQETSGTLLDLYPAGPILSLNGAKALISWDRKRPRWLASSHRTTSSMGGRGCIPIG